MYGRTNAHDVLWSASGAMIAATISERAGREPDRQEARCDDVRLRERDPSAGVASCGDGAHGCCPIRERQHGEELAATRHPFCARCERKCQLWPNAWMRRGMPR